MLKRFVLTAITLALISASETWAMRTRKNLEAALQSWYGQNADILVSQWGAPQSVYELESGGKVITYIINTASGGSSIPMGGTGTYWHVNRQWSCKVNFTTTSDNRVVRWSYEGNNCRASAPKK